MITFHKGFQEQRWKREESEPSGTRRSERKASYISLGSTGSCRFGWDGSVPPLGTVMSDECGWRQFGLWGRMSGLPRQPYQLGIWFLDPHLSLLFVAIIKLQTL